MTSIQTQSISNKPIPTRDAQFDLSRFAAWLAKAGAEIGIPSNPYEVIRYRCYPEGGAKLATHIVYVKQSGELTWCGESMRHYRLFANGQSLESQPKPDGVFLTTYPTNTAKRKLGGEVRREQLLERDGDACWFCGQPMGSDITIEHLVPKSKGGRNMLENYALAHRSCNNRAADLPLVQKIEMRQRMHRG